MPIRDNGLITEVESLKVGNTASSVTITRAGMTFADGTTQTTSAALVAPLVYGGVIDCSSNPNYPAASAGAVRVASVAGKIGGASGTVVDAGDLLICKVAAASGTEAEVGASWDIVQTNVLRPVTGPTSATDNAITRYDATTGQIVQGSSVQIDDTGHLLGVDGTGAAPSFSFINDPNTGIISSSADAVGIATGGTEHWVFNASGALNPTTDNAKDIGNGVVNPRDIAISRSLKTYGTALVGTAGAGTVAVDTWGDGRDFTTVLTLTSFVVGTQAPAAAALGLGNKVFTFPSGAHLHYATHMSVGLTCAGTPKTPEIGVGSVVASGAVAVLNGTSTFMDYITEQTAANITGTATVKTAVATAGALTGISVNAVAGVKEVFLNAAATWSADNTGNLTATGTITLRWTKLS